MKLRQYFIFSILLVLAATPAMADKSDTIRGKKRPVTYSFTESMFTPYNIWAQNGWQNMHTTDTTLNNFETYYSHYNLGNTGLPYVPVLFNTTLQPMGFFYGQDYVSNNFYADSSLRYFNSRAPFTQLYYVSDPQIHQFFQFTHAQNFGKNFNISLGFKRIRSEGNYLNQSTNMNQATLDANYHTKHYLVFADILYTVHKFQQNGGITHDTTLSSPNYFERQAIPINLNYATTEMFEQSFHVQQYYFLGFKSGDSLKVKPLFYISHALRIAGHSNVFTDNNIADSEFFKSPLYLLHSPLTYDSLRYNEFSNDISIGSGTGWTNFLRWEAGVKDQWIHFRNFVGDNPVSENGVIVMTNQSLTDDVFTNLISHARIYNAFDSGKILVDVSGQYIFSGNQQGDEQAVAQIGFKIDSTRFLKLTGSYSNQTPPFIYQLYQGNDMNWNNQFKNTITSNIGITYYDKKWKLGITLQVTKLTNMVYFDSVAAQPMQYPAILVYCVGITKDFKLHKFHWNTSEKLQYVADTTPLPLPRIVTENSVYFETPLFHHALLLRVGSDFYYNSAYFGYAYMPITDQYYLEHSTKLGNYLYVDPFVSFRIKTFRMFIKLENSTEGLNKAYNYYYALHYPMPDRTLRFGINWDFWN